MRHEAHLDLRVVGAHQRFEPVAGHEGAADPPPQLGADGNVLQVRVGGGQPSRRSDGLHVGGVDAAVGLDGGQQSVDGLPQPDAVPVRQEMLQERVPGAFEEPLEGLCVGGVPGLRASGLRHVEFLEQHRL